MVIDWEAKKTPQQIVNLSNMSKSKKTPGILDFLNSKFMTEAGSLQEIEDYSDDDDEKYIYINIKSLKSFLDLF